MKKEEFVTRKYFEKTLDKKLTQYAQVVVTAVDNILDKRLRKTEEKLEKKIDNVQTLIDGYVKAQEDFKQEFVIMKEEMRQVKKVLKQKLGIEISAM